MIPLGISRFGKALQGASSAEDAYVRLRRAGYLSLKALVARPAVVATIARAEEAFLAGPLHFGDESWRHVHAALADRGYLSLWGRSWGLLATKR